MSRVSSDFLQYMGVSKLGVSYWAKVQAPANSGSAASASPETHKAVDGQKIGRVQ